MKNNNNKRAKNHQAQSQAAAEQQPIHVDPTPRFRVDADKIKTIADIKAIFRNLDIIVRADKIQGSGLEHLMDMEKFMNSREEKIYTIAGVTQTPVENYVMLSDTEIDALYGQAYFQYSEQQRQQQQQEQEMQPLDYHIADGNVE